MKKLLALVLVAILATALFAGFASAEEDTIKIGMLPKFKGENYFDGCYVGAQQAADDLGIELVYDGPNPVSYTHLAHYLYGVWLWQAHRHHRRPSFQHEGD